MSMITQKHALSRFRRGFLRKNDKKLPRDAPASPLSAPRFFPRIAGDDVLFLSARKKKYEKERCTIFTSLGVLWRCSCAFAQQAAIRRRALLIKP